MLKREDIKMLLITNDIRHADYKLPMINVHLF